MTRRGRPPLDAHALSVSVSVRVTAKAYDALYAAARQERVTVPEKIRRELVRAQMRREDDRETD